MKIFDEPAYDTFYSYLPVVWFCATEMAVVALGFTAHRLSTSPFNYLLYCLPLFAILPWAVSRQGMARLKQLSDTEISVANRSILARSIAVGATTAYATPMSTLAILGLTIGLRG